MPNNKERIQELNVYAVPIKDNKILIMKNVNGFWEFPGGGVDFGEHPKESAKRECKEETGLELKNLSLMGVTSAVYEWRGKEKHAVYIVYKGYTNNNNISISKEHVEYRWISLDEHPKFEFGLNAKEVFNMLNI